ncbi:putative protein kinase RLK-Pelle-RLCK-VI family [Helianthus annuus]|nr:putative protein kinase RLK-Pelle-RLCK-VI family [Helianthus annuus]
MGFPRISSTQHPVPDTSSLSAFTANSDDDDDKIYLYNDKGGHKFKNFLRKMIWDFGLSCFLPTIKNKKDEMKKKMVNSLEHNKAWLLAESGGCVSEPHSVHSSFRSQELNWGRIESLERSISPVAHNLVRFSYGEILSATRNLSKGRILGRGALSYVFKGRVGILKTAVAIKKLDKEDKEAPKAFCRELMIASSLHNPFICPLVGFCIDPEGGLFLIYKYVSGGSLEHYLHETKNRKNGRSKLPWSVRYKVAIGVAEAVRYLHNGSERCVVHRDIKPSNILLSSRKSPKLCDFGLATWTSASSVPFLCKTVKGTFGYLAPEYFQHGKVSDKTDVYAFGVVLLELITGRKPIESRRGSGEENLVLWAKPLLRQGSIEKLLDPRIKFTQRNLDQIARMIQAAEASINNDESKRPNIDAIISILKGVEANEKLTKTPRTSLSSNNYVTDGYPHIHQTKNEMKSHLALAMLGVSEFEDNQDILYSC